jgi:hypothetical protein
MKVSQKNRGRSLLWRVFWGVAFLLAAVAVVCSALGVVTFGVNIGWVLLAILLIAIAAASLVNLNWWGVFIPLAGLGTIANIQTDYLPQLDGQIGALWIVAVLVAIGFSILFHSHRGSFNIGDFYEQTDDNLDDNTDKSVVRATTKFGETVKYIDSDDLEKVCLKCSFGSQKIYFDNATPSKKGIDLQIDCSFGGIELFVPKNWSIVNGVNVVAGGISEKGRAVLTDKSPELRLSGSLNFSGVEIVYI